MIPKNSEKLEFYVFKDGDMFCAVLPSFVNLQESCAGFGRTRDLAVIDLMLSKMHSAIQDMPQIEVEVTVRSDKIN